MRRTMLLGVLLAMGVVGIVAGQAPQQPNVAEIEKVRDNLFMIKGGGGNTAAFITARPRRRPRRHEGSRLGPGDHGQGPHR